MEFDWSPSQDLLTRKHAVLQFMAALSSSSSQPTPIIPPLMPSISRSSPQSPIPRSRTSSMLPPVNSQMSATRSKAQLLREYRARHGRPQISEALLLRDVLYLLQGISGKVVRFVEHKTDGELTVVFSEDPVSGVLKLVTFPDYFSSASCFLRRLALSSSDSPSLAIYMSVFQNGCEIVMVVPG
jgi:hypothetical protein